MKTVRFILAAFYLLQTIVIGFMCYFGVKYALVPFSAYADPDNDSFGEGISMGLDDILRPFEVALVIAFFLLFFIFSLVTSVLLLRQKNFATTCAVAAYGAVAPFTLALLCCVRAGLTHSDPSIRGIPWVMGDVIWGLVACAEVLLGTATIVVLLVSIRNPRRPVLSRA